MNVGIDTLAPSTPQAPYYYEVVGDSLTVCNGGELTTLTHQDLSHTLWRIAIHTGGLISEAVSVTAGHIADRLLGADEQERRMAFCDAAILLLAVDGTNEPVASERRPASWAMDDERRRKQAILSLSTARTVGDNAAVTALERYLAA